MEIKSQLSALRVYLPVGLFSLLLVTGLGLGIFVNAVEGIALLFCFTAIFGLVIMLLKAKRIFITANSITILSGLSKKVISKDDIAGIDIFARGSAGIFTLSSAYALNGTKIFMKDNEPVFFADDYYENIRALKDALKVNFAPLIMQLPAVKKNNSSYSAINYAPEKFAGNPLLTSQSISIVVIILVLLFMATRINDTAVMLLIAAVFLLAILFGIGVTLNYFLLSGTQLIIKNDVWWWRNKIIDIHDITEVIVEQPYKSAKALRITFTDYYSTSYHAASLRKKAWKQLLQRFQSLGIIVQEEVVYFL